MGKNSILFQRDVYKCIFLFAIEKSSRKLWHLIIMCKLGNVIGNSSPFYAREFVGNSLVKTKCCNKIFYWPRVQFFSLICFLHWYVHYHV